MLLKLQLTPKKTKQSYSGKKKVTTKHKYYRTRKPKIIATSFFARKNMIILYLKNQKSQF
ncbi:hypothetical protein [Spiroplasma poulsonii]|uniref:hypothetical protein n=1 Tax=Spiroplasma poulsonii TaxID=2138 RepID=UPI001F4D1233|nr:hypothetical protein [Spiroplasma poulsonii]UNF62619.1 hypothetical protein MNU24_03995 [Spiroplasma poulsonii]